MSRKSDPDNPYVSRGGLKLRFALDEFGIDVANLRCVDLGCSTGGFTDCLLQGAAAEVVAIDTGYGVLAYKLRIDERVRVLERTNALHVEAEGRFDLVVMDLGWTPQRLGVEAARRWLGEGGRIVSLVKPHYEAKGVGLEELLEGGVLAEHDAERVCGLVVEGLGAQGVEVLGVVRSPLLGGKTRGVKKGNVEFLAHLRFVGS